MADYFKTMNQWSFTVPVLVLLMLAMMIFPLPPFLLDILFTFNISLSLMVLLACVYTQRPLNFSVFPTILLLTTLLRLALNIASTRVVLLHGHTGTYAAGQVIHSFGSVVIGSNSAVGLVVFTILVIVNFVVVTKGATRVSEVSARFTLDAIPGKQMAIDADLNAGLITQEQAKIRRDEISQEADFYGSMDGTSKFVRGDAIACILILMVNLLGGLFIGVLQHGMSLSHAIHNYTLLTIGDGLVAQIPALLLSIATAIIVTRERRSTNISLQVIAQLFDNPQTLGITALVLCLMGLIPGMPHFVFLSLGVGAAFGMYYLQKFQSESVTTTGSGTRLNARLGNEQAYNQHEQQQTTHDLNWNDVTPLDVIGIEIGYRLIDLVNHEQSTLLSRMTNVRKKLSQEIGFLIPSVHIRDNLELKPSHYRIMLMGVCYGEAMIIPDRILAINPSAISTELDGIQTKDPTFGLDAVWINHDQNDYAQSLGFTLVDPETVIASHLSQVLQSHADQLLGHEEAQQLLDRLATTAPNLVEALVPKAISLSIFVTVLRQLLAERIPIIDIRNIAATLVDAASKSDEPNELTAAVRVALKRYIVQRIIGNSSQMEVITLKPELEALIKQAPTIEIALEPSQAETILDSLTQYQQQNSAPGKPTIVLCSDKIRGQLSRFIRRHFPDIHTLCYAEIPDDKSTKVNGTLFADI